MKRIFEFKLGHGWFGGHKKETDVICTIDSGISMWHTLILEELADDNEITQREREFLSRTRLNKVTYMLMTRILSTYHRGWNITEVRCSTV